MSITRDVLTGCLNSDCLRYSRLARTPYRNLCIDVEIENMDVVRVQTVWWQVLPVMLARYILMTQGRPTRVTRRSRRPKGRPAKVHALVTLNALGLKPEF